MGKGTNFYSIEKEIALGKGLAQEMAVAVAAGGEAAVQDFTSRLDDMKITLKEKIELGEVVRIEAAPGNVIDSYLHIQGGRGVIEALPSCEAATSW